MTKLLDWLRRKYLRRRLPRQLRHMRALHPAFALRAETDNGDAYSIFWRGRAIGKTRPLDELRRARPGEHGFIIASGPSLSALDLQLQALRHLTCFGVNGSIAAAPLGPNFRYHVITDRQFVIDRFELTEAVLQSDAQCLLTFRVINQICERRPELLARDGLFLLAQPNTRYGEPKRDPAEFYAWASRQPELLLHPRVQDASDWVGFSKDLRCGAFSGQTVAFSALQVAYALGYRRVHLLGVDLGGAQRQFARFYEQSSDERPAPTRLDRDFEPYIQPAFEVAAQLCQSDDFRVYNLSPNSRLPSSVIPHLSYPQALRQAQSATGV